MIIRSYVHNVIFGENRPKNIFFSFSGIYTCTAETKTNIVTDSGQLTVRGIAPEIINGPTEMTIKAGEKIVLLCETKGSPTPRIIWWKVKISTLIA